MKKLLMAIAATMLWAASSFSQTTLNLTVQDTPDNQTWNNGTWQVQLIPGSGNPDQTRNFTLLVAGGSLASQSGSLSATGTASFALPANANIGPAGTKWQFTVCSQAATSCSVANITVTTSSPQTVNVNPPSIRVAALPNLPPVLVYTTTEISSASIGSQITVVGSTPSTPALQNCTVVSGNTCTTWTQVGSSSGGSPNATALLSSQCVGVSAPCINIPAGSGGCFVGAITTSGQPTITFTSGFPAGIAVGMEVWVTINGGSKTQIGGCPSLDTNNPFTNPTNDCGSHSTVTALTVQSIVPGTSITLNGNCSVTQAGSNAWLYYGFNIYSQMVAACQAVGTTTGDTPNTGSVSVQDGVWVLDNLGAGTAGAAACGPNAALNSQLIPFAVYASGGAGFLMPPWYNGVGDTGTVFHGPKLTNISLIFDWTSNTITHGTPWYAGACGSRGVKIIGFNAGINANSEAIYPAQSAGMHTGNCVMDDFYITAMTRGIVVGGNGSNATVRHSTIVTGGSAIINQNTQTLGNIIRIEGSNLYSKGQGPGGSNNGSVIDNDNGTGTADVYQIVDSNICNGGSTGVQGIRDTETSGEIELISTRINKNCPIAALPVGTNAGGVSITSGVTLRVKQSDIVAAGTGNTVTYPSGSNFFLDSDSTLSGGAGLSSGGTAHHTESGTCTFAAATTCAVTFSTPFGSTPGFYVAPNIVGTATTLTVSALSATGATITASASNSATVAWSASLQ